MTIGIVIPLKSKQISRDWKVTCDSLESTIKSIMAQTDSDYKVVIVGHDKPEFLTNLNDANIEFKTAEFAAPNRNLATFTTQDLINDKRLKIISALFELRNVSLQYIYQLDSDDLIHRDFIKLIKTVKGYACIILNRGYLYYKSSHRYIETDELDQLCGSTVVALAGSFEMPTEVDLKWVDSIPWTKYRHRSIYRYFEETDQKTTKVDFKLVSYVLASGDNFSDRWRDNWFKALKWNLKPYLIGNKANKNFCDDFCL